MSFKLAHLLIQEGIISEDSLETVFERRQREGDQGLSLDADLCLEGYLTPPQANDFLAQAFKLKPIALPQLQTISSLALAAIEKTTAETYQIFPYLWDSTNDSLHVVSTDFVSPAKLKILAEELHIQNITLSLISQVYFEQLRHHHYKSPIHEKLKDLAKQWPLLPSSAGPALTAASTVPASTVPVATPEAAPAVQGGSRPSATTLDSTASIPSATPNSSELGGASPSLVSAKATQTAPVPAATHPTAPTASSLDTLFGLDSGNIDDLLGLNLDADPIGSLLKSVSSTALPAVPEKSQPQAPASQPNLSAAETTSVHTGIASVSSEMPTPVPLASEAKTSTPTTPAPSVTFPPQKLPIRLSIMDLECLLQHARERDSVFKLGLYFIAGMTDQAAIFTIPGNQAKGFMLHGPEELQRVFQHITISLDANTIFRKLRDSVVPYSGTMPQTHSDRVFFALFDPPPQRVYFFPVRLRGRNVCMLYGHRLHVPLSSDEYEQLIRSIQLLSHALEQVILAKKQGEDHDPQELTQILGTLWAGDVQGFQEQIRFFRPTKEDDDDFLFESPVVVQSQQELAAIVGPTISPRKTERAPLSLQPQPTTALTSQDVMPAVLEQVLPATVTPPSPSSDLVPESVALQSPASSPVLSPEPPVSVQIVSSGRGLAFSDDAVSHDEHPQPPSSELGEGTFDLLPVVPEPPTSTISTISTISTTSAPPTEPPQAPPPHPQPTLELGSFSPEMPPTKPSSAHEDHPGASSAPSTQGQGEEATPSSGADSSQSTAGHESSSGTHDVKEPELVHITEFQASSLPTPAMIPVGSRIIGGEFLNPSTSRDGAEISSSYIESILMPTDLFGETSLIPTPPGQRSAAPHHSPHIAETPPVPEPLEDDDIENVPVTTQQTQPTTTPPTSSTQEAKQEEAAVEFDSAEPVTHLKSQAPEKQTEYRQQKQWGAPKVEREIVLEEEYKPSFFNPPVVEAAEALLPLPNNENERQTAIAALKELTPHDIVVALLSYFPGRLQRNQVQQDGTLLFEASTTPDGEAWNLLLAYPQETLIGIQPVLYHEQRHTRLMALFLLQQLPGEPLLPHFFRFLLDADPAIAAQARRLTRLFQDTPLYQGLLSWLRHQLTRASGNHLVRTIRILSKIQDAAAVPELIDLLENSEPGMQSIVHAALIEITKQTLPPQHKKWLKWWDKTGSQTDRIDWLIEGLEQSEPQMVHASWIELRELTGQDFGFAPDAPKKQRHDAIKSWKRWRKENLS